VLTAMAMLCGRRVVAGRQLRVRNTDEQQARALVPCAILRSSGPANLQITWGSGLPAPDVAHAASLPAVPR
jgi:hypothetical protein